MCSNCEGQASDTFVRGMATILWADAWANHAEEHDCVNLSGCEVTEYMPEIPEMAWRMAERLAGMIEQANDLNLAACYASAMRAMGREDLTHPDYHDATALRFGECLAWEAMGAGVSWEDDHPPFLIYGGVCKPDREMTIPHFEAFDLQLHADDTCEVCHGS